jgi:hypothetical protein
MNIFMFMDAHPMVTVILALIGYATIVGTFKAIFNPFLKRGK